MTEPPKLMGRVTRCSTRSFVGAVRLPQPELPVFGTLCRAQAQQGASYVIGAIFNIIIEDDEFARQMAALDTLPAEQRADQRMRQEPVEFEALALGIEREGQFIYALPPQPPLTLAAIHPLSDEDLIRFTDRLDFLPLIFNAVQAPAEDLAAAVLLQAAQKRPQSQRREFLLRAGRACARLLARDLNRLDTLLQRLAALSELGAAR